MKLCSLALAAVLGIGAQTCPPGELRVFVVDSQGSPVFGANVRVGPESALIAERLTESTGMVNFERVQCGSWTVSAAKDGFETAVKTAQITGGGVATVSLVLSPKMVRSSVDVVESAPPVEQAATNKTELHPTEVKTLPTNPATVTDTLPLVPGVVRSQDGELKIAGTSEQHSALVVNQTDVTDPATGKFGQTVPVDSIETVTVLNTPFLAQYGRFTAGVVAIETRRGGEKWHAELNDPLPDVRVRSWHLRGIRNETPRGVVSGPLIRNRLYFNTALQYFFQKEPSRTLPFPFNESKQESVNLFTQVDYIISPRQLATATLHVSPQHTNFVNPDFFNPQPVTPSFAQHVYVGTLAHHFSLFGGILDSSISLQRYNVFVGAQGESSMVLTPVGNRGDYFGRQNRAARRTEWLESWSAPPAHFLGTHLLKVGTSLTGSGDDGQFTYQPVEIRAMSGRLLQRLDFSNRNAFTRTGLEEIVYGQDHWELTPRLSIDYGARFEHQRLPQNLRIAPRAGLAWTPFSSGRTIFRTGYGQFYDHVPLGVYTFSRFPERTITNFAPDGSILGDPIHFTNVIGSVTGPRSFLVAGKPVAGAFAPRGLTWNAQVEHIFSPLLRIRAVYTDNRSVGLVVLEPDILGVSNEIVLNGDGRSRYRQAEITARFSWKEGQQLILSYTRSRSEGDLNTFDTYLGNFPKPLIRPDVYSNLPGDLPNRFLAWGRLRVP
ncbi:MAG TPA: TonB-dependent receptor, partial [Bryobacteraceae bacterium]|nr:TonB-dependent receptor [Bryobacteraceae bacterium]